MYIGKPASSGKSASYESKSCLGEIGGIPYRFAVVHSSALDWKKRKGLENMTEAERAEIEKAVCDLRRR